MHRPSGIIFDYGNTLLMEDYFDWLAGFRQVLTFAVGSDNPTAEEIMPDFQNLYNETNLLRNSSGIEFTNRSLQKVLYETMGISIRLTPEEMENEFWRAAQRFRPAVDIEAVLDWIKEQGLKTGVVSNCPFNAAVMREELIKYGFDQYFDFLISSADYGFRKPHPRLFRTALGKMEMPAQDVWFVGDNLYCDVRGANDSGLSPVWYNPFGQSNSEGYPCLEVKSWDEFLLLVQQY